MTKKQLQEVIDHQLRASQPALKVADGVLMSIPDVAELTIPDGVTSVDRDALLGASALTAIHLPAAICEIGSALSNYCYARKANRTVDVTFAGRLGEWLANGEPLANYVRSLLVEGIDLYNISVLTIPQGVTTIGSRVMSECNNLQQLVLSASVVNIGSHAFAYCENLRSVRILGPADVGQSAFTSCHHLSSIYLADGVKSLGSNCFSYLDSCDHLFIPKSVERVAADLSNLNHEATRWIPSYFCEANEKPEGWSDNWHRAYIDRLIDRKFYHRVGWGFTREEFERRTAE